MSILPIHLPVGPLPLDPCRPFLPETSPNDYLRYISAQTSGRITPSLNGRNTNSNKPDIIVAEAFDVMQTFIETLKDGDSVYLASWMFNSSVPLTIGSSVGARTWGDLFGLMASRGVRIRILMTEFDPKAPFFIEIRIYIDALNKIIDSTKNTVKDNLQFQVTIQPVTGLTRIIGREDSGP